MWKYLNIDDDTLLSQGKSISELHWIRVIVRTCTIYKWANARWFRIVEYEQHFNVQIHKM